ncbi:hypothetical protein FHS42_001256 [Streptomyces zagrosensis]|uniref:Uncharacterized protein n=1 Tax=Streptomyces zagrosensis TaxID=1042984 RepID=A0A7W9UWS3_9ACTN|nr:hypothetical protein [Streptomyces zagrosensis]
MTPDPLITSVPQQTAITMVPVCRSTDCSEPGVKIA